MNSNEVVRTNLITNQQDILSPKSNANGHRINAYEYISRRLKSPRHKIFGSSGREIWYGNSISKSDQVVDSIWNDIETHTDKLKVNHNNFPFSEIEKRNFICINTSGRSYVGDSFTRVELSGDTVSVRECQVLEDPPEVITEDYRGETIVFSNEIEIEVLGIDGDDLRDRDPPITCQSLRLFMTPLRDDMYVEIDDDYYNQVYLMPIEQELFVSKATIGFNSDEARPSFTCELERGVSIFEDFNTEKIVNITLDKNYETIWTSNIGPRTRGRNFKVQFRGMYVYYKLRKMIFETFFLGNG